MRISDWSSDVCSSDLHAVAAMLGKRARDDRVAVGPVADQRDDARLVEGLLHRLALDRARFVRLARQAPVGGEIDENGLSGRAGLGERDRKSTRLNSSH